MNQRWGAPFALGCVVLLTAMTAVAGNVDPRVVREALQRPVNASSSANGAAQPDATATKTSPLEAFSVLGSGTLISSNDVTCSNAACASSGGDCQCLKYQGTLSSKPFGTGTWTAGVTVNIDDCTNTGTPNGFCCIGDGMLTATDESKTPNTLTLSITGSVCADPNASTDVGVSATYIIVPSATGKYAHTTGTGQLNLYSVDPSVDPNQPAYLSGEGTIQLDSPF
jgi:hypothetical protein